MLLALLLIIAMIVGYCISMIGDRKEIEVADQLLINSINHNKELHENLEDSWRDIVALQESIKEKDAKIKKYEEATEKFTEELKKLTAIIRESEKVIDTQKRNLSFANGQLAYYKNENLVNAN